MHIKENEKVLVFRNEKGNYSIGLSRKDRNNQVYYGYFPCQFKKNVEVNNKSRIMIRNAFMSFYLKEEKTMPYIMILDYSLIQDEKNYLQMKDEMEDNSEMPF